MLRFLPLLCWILFTLPAEAQTPADPTEEWRRQIELQIRQDPSSGERLIRRLTLLRDEDILKRLHVRWNEHPFGELNAEEKIALFEVDRWLAQRTGNFQPLLDRLKNTLPEEVQSREWMRTGEMLRSRREYSLARDAWSNLESSSMATLRCPALHGISISFLQEGLAVLTEANPDLPSPRNLFEQADRYLSLKLQDDRCLPVEKNDLRLARELIDRHPASMQLIQQLSQQIPPEDPLRQSHPWNWLVTMQLIQNETWSEGKQLLGSLLESTTDRDEMGELRWYLALIEVQLESVGMAELQYSALSRNPASDRINDLIEDLALLESLSNESRLWYSGFMLQSTMPADSLLRTLNASRLTEQSGLHARLWLRVHQRVGHIHGLQLLDGMQSVADRLDASDPLKPEIQWAILQQLAWEASERSTNDPLRSRYRSLRDRFVDQYPGHPMVSSIHHPEAATQ